MTRKIEVEILITSIVIGASLGIIYSLQNGSIMDVVIYTMLNIILYLVAVAIFASRYKIIKVTIGVMVIIFFVLTLLDGLSNSSNNIGISTIISIVEGLLIVFQASRLKSQKDLESDIERISDVQELFLKFSTIVQEESNNNTDNT